MVTNKDLQETLKHYGDNYSVYVDKAFGWDNYSELEDIHLCINTDIEQIEICPCSGYKDLDVNTVRKVIKLYDQIKTKTNDSFNENRTNNMIVDTINGGYENVLQCFAINKNRVK